MGWIILFLFLIVVFIVWIALTRSAKKYHPDFETGAHDEVHEEEAAAPNRAAEIPLSTGELFVEETPVEPTRAAEIPSIPDDLKIVEGIGPKVSSILNEAGIFTFTQLSMTSESTLRAILENAKLGFMDPSTWAEQARLAGEGKLDDLKALQNRLTAGRN